VDLVQMTHELRQTCVALEQQQEARWKVPSSHLGVGDWTETGADQEDVSTPRYSHVKS